MHKNALDAEPVVASLIGRVYAVRTMACYAILTYQLSDGATQLVMDLFPAAPHAGGPSGQALKARFRMIETHEIAGGRSLRADVEPDEFLEYLGKSWDEALAKWPLVAWMWEYRTAHGEDTYAGVASWSKFYDMLAAGNVPTRIGLCVVEG